MDHGADQGEFSIADQLSGGDAGGLADGAGRDGERMDSLQSEAVHVSTAYIC
jgi:hypothetical protein